MSSTTSRKSLIEQILEATFDKLEKSEIFNLKNVQQLRKLAINDDLRKHSQIIDALKVDLGEQNETY